MAADRLDGRHRLVFGKSRQSGNLEPSVSGNTSHGNGPATRQNR